MRVRGRDPLRTQMVVAMIVVAVDITTKAVAIGALSGGRVELAGPFFLTLLYNDALLAGSVDLNDWALRLSVVASSLLVLLAFPVCRSLAEVDDVSPLALGLIVGAAVANPASLVLEPAGVTDFIGASLGSGVSVVFNLADVACYVGLAMTGRTFLLLLAQYNREQRVPQPSAGISIEREVPIGVWRDDTPEPRVPLSVPVRAELIPLIAESADHHDDPASYQPLPPPPPPAPPAASPSRAGRRPPRP